MTAPPIDYEAWYLDKKAVTAEELQRMESRGCSIPGCAHEEHSGPLYIHSRCHQYKGVQVAIFKGDVFVSCSACHQFIARFSVPPGGLTQ